MAKSKSISKINVPKDPRGWYVYYATFPLKLQKDVAYYNTHIADPSSTPVEAFVPKTRYDVLEEKALPQEKLITGFIVFLRGKVKDLELLANEFSGDSHISLYRSKLPDGSFSREPMEIPEKQMKTFLTVCRSLSYGLEFETVPLKDLQAGDKVLVTLEDGREVECIIPKSPESKRGHGMEQHLVIPLSGNICVNLSGMSLSSVKFLAFGEKSTRRYDVFKTFFPFADQALERFNAGAGNVRDRLRAKEYLRRTSQLKADTAIMASKLSLLRLICHTICGNTEELENCVKDCNEAYHRVSRLKWVEQHEHYMEILKK